MKERSRNEKSCTTHGHKSVAIKSQNKTILGAVEMKDNIKCFHLPFSRGAQRERLKIFLGYFSLILSDHFIEIIETLKQ